MGAWLNHLLKKGKKATVAEAQQTRVHLFDEAKEELGNRTIYYGTPRAEADIWIIERK